MKKLTVLATTLVMSASVFAGTQTFHKETTVTTDAFADKAQAYDAGFAYIDSLKQMSNPELRFELPTNSANFAKNIQLDDTSVAIEEFAKSRGEIAYRAVVSVDYHFNADDNTDD